jgi:diamine N-acetyltransferase
MPDATVVGPEAEVTLREVTAETLYVVCQLSDTLTEPQKHMVAPNAYSIAEAHFAKHAWFRAIYADEVPVGFIMLHDSAEEEPGYLIWRLMIGGPFQGMGFGRKAVELLIDYVRTRPGANELLTSCGLGEGSPEGFYLELGFKHTGKMLGHEAVLSLPL